MKFLSVTALACVFTLSLSIKASEIELALADTEDYATFFWSGNCSDCLSYRGDTSFSFANFASGNIILDGYVAGEDFSFDQSNIVSFQYDGPSNHIDRLVVHNANYSNEDFWEDDNMFLPIGFTTEIAGAFLNPEAVINGYTHFGENMSASGSISADLSDYQLTLEFDTLVALDDNNEYIPFSSLSGDEDDVTTFRKDTFRVLFESNGSWSISVNGIENDLGNGAAISLVSVPEPDAFIIFSIALFGMIRKRINP